MQQARGAHSTGFKAKMAQFAIKDGKTLAALTELYRRPSAPDVHTCVQGETLPGQTMFQALVWKQEPINLLFYKFFYAGKRRRLDLLLVASVVDS